MFIRKPSWVAFVCLSVVLAIVVLNASPATAASCESLVSLKLPNTMVTSATIVDAGTFTPPTAGGSGNAGRAPFTQYATMPTFCRVTATMTPSIDSDIKIEVWMPVSGWNGKLESVGNGGWAGTISYPALASVLMDGYTTASTDTGHASAGGSFALGHSEKLIDYAYRAVHEMTVAAKAVIAAFYSQGPTISYFRGCSTGGRQALAEAQLYPEDYKGIIAGAPANYNFHFDRDVDLADQMDLHTINDIDPNLKDFFGHGGKLLMFHGWSDPVIAPLNSVNYYESVLKNAGAAKAQDSIRLFMLPGMAHCGNGEGPNRFETMDALTQWVEKGQAPKQMIASHFTNAAIDRTRPVCPYPQIAAYKGTGSTDDAANFICKAP